MDIERVEQVLASLLQLGEEGALQDIRFTTPANNRTAVDVTARLRGRGFLAMVDTEKPTVRLVWGRREDEVAYIDVAPVVRGWASAGRAN